MEIPHVTETEEDGGGGLVICYVMERDSENH